jgi:proline iminopeptidase
MTTAIAHAWQAMYPPLQSHAHGWLPVGDGHEVFWQECGNPLGQPALFVHGGPGAGCTPDDRRWFDPRHYRIVLFDQRGAGRSRPQGGLEANTTDDLVGDIEAVRRHLHIERWLLLGGSWGAALALAYAERYPQRTRALVLRGVFTGTDAERCALYGAHWRDGLETLAAHLHSGSTHIEHAAVRRWQRWEQDLMAHELPAGAPEPATAVTPAALAAARIGVHYTRGDYFLDEAELLTRATFLHDVPGTIVQGERDRVTLPATARALHRAWPGSRLILLADAGHASRHPQMAQALIEATDACIDTHHPTAQESRDERRQASL